MHPTPRQVDLQTGALAVQHDVASRAFDRPQHELAREEQPPVFAQAAAARADPPHHVRRRLAQAQVLQQVERRLVHERRLRFRQRLEAPALDARPDRQPGRLRRRRRGAAPTASSGRGGHEAFCRCRGSTVRTRERISTWPGRGTDSGRARLIVPSRSRNTRLVRLPRHPRPVVRYQKALSRFPPPARAARRPHPAPPVDRPYGSAWRLAAPPVSGTAGRKPGIMDRGWRGPAKYATVRADPVGQRDLGDASRVRAPRAIRPASSPRGRRAAPAPRAPSDPCRTPPARRGTTPRCAPAHRRRC